MQPIQLDERLSLAMDLFPACEEGADIGPDHGRLPCRLLEEGRCRRMILSDISPKALSRAEALVQRRGLQGRARWWWPTAWTPLPTGWTACPSWAWAGAPLRKPCAAARSAWPERPWCFPHIQSFRKCVRPWKKSVTTLFRSACAGR